MEPTQTSTLTSARAEELRRLRREIEESVRPEAYSLDGLSFTYQAPPSMQKLLIGSYIVIDVDADTRILGEVIGQHVESVEGPEVGFNVAAPALGLSGDDGGMVQFANKMRMRIVRGEGSILGVLTPAGFMRPARGANIPESPFRVATDAEIREYLTTQTNAAGLEVGQSLYAEGDVPVQLAAKGFNRHTFLCGQSGSGKTFSLGIILERLLLETDLQIIVIDPNSDFVHLHECDSHEVVNRTHRTPLTAEAYAALRARYAAVAEQVQIFRPRSLESPHVLQFYFSGLNFETQATLLQLDPLTDREEYNVFRQTLESLTIRPYSLRDVQTALAANLSMEARNLALRIQNLGVADWEIWSRTGDAPIGKAWLEDDWRCIVLDVGTLTLPAEKMITAEALLQTLWKHRRRRRPVLIVIDEAHNICPQEAENYLQTMSTNLAVLIAGEGRKFGLYMLLASQRPAKVHGNVLSQCDNLILMRMNSTADLEHVQHLFSQVPQSMLHQAAQFRQGESVVAGGIVSYPTFVRFGGRLSQEGGGDIPTRWANPARGSA